MMTDATPDQIEHATAIANKLVPLQVHRRGPEWLGAYAAALAAIIETEARVTERAARWIEKRMEVRFAEYGTREPDTNATYYSGRYGETLETLDEENEDIVLALRSGEHMKEA